MKKIFFLIMPIIFVASATTYAKSIERKSIEPNQKILSAALEKHLAKQGDLCIGKFEWPIDVSQHDVEIGARDAVQMPVLEKLGLVMSSTGSTLRKENSETEEFVAVKHYALTDAGKKFYINKLVTSVAPGGKKITHQKDFCVAKLSLDKLVRWDKVAAVGDHQETTATYTYTIAAADWTRDPEVQKVFPMVDHIIKGEKSMEMKQRMRLTNDLWVAVNPLE